MKKYIVIFLLAVLCSIEATAQVDKKDVRAGNRKFRKEDYKTAEISFRTAQAKDTTSVMAAYDLGTTLYKEGEYEEAAKMMDKVKEQAPMASYADRYWFNRGDAALQAKDWQTAVDAFKKSLLLNPGDLDAKESYIYAKKMLENQQQNQDQNQDQQQNQDNQDQQQNQDNQDQQQNQDQNQDKQDQDQNDQNQQQEPQQQEQKISPQQAQQMLNAIQAKEKDTQEKVKKEKAAMLQSRQKEKNW